MAWISKSAPMSTNFFHVTTDSSPPVIYRGQINLYPDGFEIKILTENVAYDGRVTMTL